MRGWGLLLGIAIIVLMTLATALLPPRLDRTGVVVPIRDALSGAPVWDVSIGVGGWSSLAFSTPASRFLSVLPGRRTLTAEAPGYLPASEEVAVRLGSVTEAPPLRLIGYRIPGLQGFALSAERGREGLSIHLAPVDPSGHPIREFPCLDIHVVARIFIQTDRGAVATEPSRGPTGGGALGRGTQLFEGVARWSWDSAPGSAYRYRILVPNERIAPLPAPYVVVDALVVVPDPRRIGRSEVEQVARELAANDTPSIVGGIERRYQGRLSIYDTVAWNVANS